MTHAEALLPIADLVDEREMVSQWEIDTPKTTLIAAKQILATSIRDYLGQEYGEFGYGDNDKLAHLRAINAFSALIPGGVHVAIESIWQFDADPQRRAELATLLDPDFSQSFSRLADARDGELFFHHLVSAAEVIIHGPLGAPEAYHHDGVVEQWTIVEGLLEAASEFSSQNEDKGRLVVMVSELAKRDVDEDISESDMIAAACRYGEYAPWAALEILEMVSDEALEPFVDKAMETNVQTFFSNVRFDFFSDNPSGHRERIGRVYAQLERLPTGSVLSAKAVALTALSLQEQLDKNHQQVPRLQTPVSYGDVSPFYLLLTDHMKAIRKAGWVVTDERTYQRIVRLFGELRGGYHQLKFRESGLEDFEGVLAATSKKLRSQLYEKIIKKSDPSIDQAVVRGFLSLIVNNDPAYMHEVSPGTTIPRWVMLGMSHNGTMNNDMLMMIKALLFEEHAYAFIDTLFSHGQQDWLGGLVIPDDFKGYVRGKEAEYWKKTFFEFTKVKLKKELDQAVASGDLQRVDAFTGHVLDVTREKGADDVVLNVWIQQTFVPYLKEKKLPLAIKQGLAEIIYQLDVRLEFNDYMGIFRLIPKTKMLRYLEMQFLSQGSDRVVTNPEQIVHAMENKLLRGISEAAQVLIGMDIEATLAPRVDGIIHQVLADMVKRHTVDRRHPKVRKNIKADDRKFLESLRTSRRWLRRARKSLGAGINEKQLQALLIAL